MEPVLIRQGPAAAAGRDVRATWLIAAVFSIQAARERTCPVIGL